MLFRSRWTVHGQHSGVEGEFRYSQISTLREGRAILIEYFFEHEQALAAVGLTG